ncbi:MAG: HAMP domain-containing protein [Acidobacteria bacterium]|nr:HAMP domain-containing protein [Acidobacteriota bacterium]
MVKLDRKPPTRRWYLLGLSLLLLALMTIVFWQTSLSFGEFRPSDVQETLLLWGISTLVFLLMVTLGFILFRNIVKLYIERRGNRLGSRIKTKLVAGALALTILPVLFLFFFSFNVLNRTLDKWFNQPIERLQKDSLEISERLKDASRERAETLAAWIASLPEVSRAVRGRRPPAGLSERLSRFARERRLSYIAVVDRSPQVLLAEYSSAPRFAGLWRKLVQLQSQPESPGSALLSDQDRDLAIAFVPAGAAGTVFVGWQAPEDLAAKQEALATQYRSYQEQARHLKFMRYFYVGMLLLITLFILFVATWIALFLSRQIVVPIEALVQATAQVSSGRLEYRIERRAIDELGLLVRSFNQMTKQLEHSRDELEARRRFTETILESIPTGVISLSPFGDIQRVNSALGRIFSPQRAADARRLEHLFSGEGLREVRRLVRRAQRTGLATATLDLASGGQTQHLAVTVSALESDERDPRAPRPSSPRSCVIVVEDSSELLRAQKSAAWEEVAQRVAHEIKNPLTPIALSAERMSRLVEKYGSNQDVRVRLDLERLLAECTATITREIDTLKTLVDEFSQFARFPAARPGPGDLNEVVETALESLNGRLAGLHIRKQLSPGLPPVSVDPERFRRAVVNLLENAIEAMTGEPPGAAERTLTITTGLGAAPDTVELAIADSGHGITPQDREKLFLPYFSTRKRGTGLGLAIVSRIVAEHKGAIRVEDNHPRGTRFIVELPTVEVKVPA